LDFDSHKDKKTATLLLYNGFIILLPLLFKVAARTL